MASVTTALLLWTVKYPAMTDLPQHAAQISAWVNIGNPEYGFDKQFEVRLLTPYLAAYLPTRLLAEPLGVLAALKTVITLIALTHMGALYVFLRELQADPWWALLGFPLAFGYSFAWGFINYYAAIPLGIAYLVPILRFKSNPTWRRSVGIFALTTALFFAHGLVFAVCGLGAAGILIISSRNIRDAAIKCTPLLASLAIALTWAAWAQSDSISESYPYKGNFGWHRTLELFPLLFGTQQDDYAGFLGVLVVVLLVGIVRLDTSDIAARCAPLMATLIAYFAIPQDAMNVALLYPRIAVFAVPFALLALPPRRYRTRASVVHLALAGICLTWGGVAYLRAFSFDEDARQYDKLIARMRPNQRVRHLIFERGDTHTPGNVPFIHFPIWYQVDKGGEFAFTFAHTDVAVIRFKDGKTNAIRAGMEWHPSAFDIDLEHNRFDYFVVRASEDYGAQLFSQSPSTVRLVERAGMWWLYAHAHSPPRPSL